MSQTLNILLPEPGALRSVHSPHGHGPTGVAPLMGTLLVAGVVVSSTGVVLFGWHALRVLAISIAVTVLIESVFAALTQRSRSWSEGHALLIGILLACTLPPTASWQVVVTASALAILVGQIVPGGVGNYLWHPVALGRVAVQMLFHEQLTPARWPVLAPGRFVTGSLDLARELPILSRWDTQPLPAGIEAWLVTRPVDHLRSVLPVDAAAGPAEALAQLVSDALPPWPATLTGGAGGAIGEACVIAALGVGLLLTWRGLLRWPALLAALASVAVLAAVLPVHIQPAGESIQPCWLPGLLFHQGLPVGWVYVCYHLTAGAFPFVLCILAADPTSTPLTSRGHLVFGLVIGAATVLLRILAGVPASAYWALLIANTCVPVINRLTRRRVFGVARAAYIRCEKHTPPLGRRAS